MYRLISESAETDWPTDKVKPFGGVTFSVTERPQKISIRTDCIEIAANMVQSIARYLNLSELASTCDFPVAMEQLKNLIDSSTAHQVTREQMIAELAEKKQLIRNLTVLAEDHRLVGNW
ncbi:unnamed protein product [Echinostoma caproni]|uniref:BBS2_C domain-containing protein n=1 Tax=Echinostoma caproni TaxID=27848 RepID=A0A183AZK7_9TREM|nr:unnamed protein product [Echinostoma caproni]